MATRTNRRNLLLTLSKRLVAFPQQIWRNLGTNDKYRWPSAVGYTLGAISVLYSVFSLLYDYNIDLRVIVRLPLLMFYREEVLPFLASPLTYVGVNLGRLGSVLLSASLIGGSIMANAEFRNRFRWLTHMFVRRESGPRFDLEVLSENPGLPEPPTHSLMSRVVVYGLAALVGYSFFGLLAFAAFIPFGLYFFLRDLRYLLTWVSSHIFYVVEHVLAPYERWDDDQYWGTRGFLAVFKRRCEFDSISENYYIDFWRVDSVDPKQRTWVAVKNSVRDGGRVVALAMWLLVLVLGMSRALL